MDDGRKGHGGDSEWRDQCRRWMGNRKGNVVDRECHWKGPKGPGRDEGGKGGGGSRGHRVDGGGGGGGGRRIRTEGGVGSGGRSIATGLGRKPVGGCYSAEMRRPAFRSTAHDPILSYPTTTTTNTSAFNDTSRHIGDKKLNSTSFVAVFVFIPHKLHLLPVHCCW